MSLTELRDHFVAQDDDGWTQLHWLCFAVPTEGAHRKLFQEWKDRVQFLRHNGAGLDLPCKRGWTPRFILILLKRHGYAECCDLLQVDPEVHPLPRAILSVLESVPIVQWKHGCVGCLIWVRTYAFLS